MKDKLKKTTATILGQKAEEFLKNRLTSEENHYSDVDIIKLTHELEVYQIELELQNDELHLAKTRAEEEAKKYTNLYDFAPSGYFTLSKNGEIIALNFSGANLLGKERSYLLNKRFGLFVSDQTRPIFNLFLEDLFETRTRQTCEIALANPSLYLNLSGIISDDEEQCLVTMHDISQLKKAELDIKISEENYHNLYERNRDSIIIFRLDSDGNPGKIIKANKTTTEIFGYTQKELLSMSVSDVEIVDEELRKTRVNTLLKNGKIDFETIIKDKKGNYRFVDIETVFIEYENEPAVMNITRDITERKQLEENSRKAQENLTTILEAIPDLLFEVGMDSKIYYYQAHRQDLLSIAPDEIIGKYFKDIMPTDVTQICFAALKEADEKGWSIGKQYSLQLPHGKHWFELSVSPIHDKSHTSKRFIILARDITERKLAEEKLVASEYLLNQTQNIAHLGSYILDFKTGEWTSSAVLNSIFGIDSTTEKNIELWVSILHQEWKSIMTDYLYKEVIGNKSYFNKEYKIIKSDTKEERWVHGMGKITFNEEGQPLHLIGSIQDITERKIAEENLKLSSERFQNLVNSTGGIVWEADANTFNFTYVSQEAERLLGYPIEEWKTAGFWANHLHPDEKEKTIAFCVSQTEKMEAHDFIYRFKSKKGNYVWLRDIVNIVIENGKPRWLRGVMFDITKQKETNQLLIESEEKYRGLIENSPDGIVIYVNEKITYANGEALRIIKAKNREQIIGKSVLEFIHPDSIESVIQRMKEVVMDVNASSIVEEKLVCLNGETLYAELKAIPTIFENQNAIQVIIHDITERKRTQDKIKQLSQAVEQSPVAIVITNTNGAIEYINPKFTETTGYSFDEILGQNSRILKSGHTSHNEYVHLWQTLIAGEEWFGEFQNKRKDGTLYWESASISPILNSQGKATHYIAIKEDITERKHIEQQLIKAKEKAEESDRLKLAFLANMSHEIRTPMNGIIGFTELLKERNLDTEVQQEYIKIIEKSGIRMLNIINDIISISKIESGQVDITLSETDINEQLEFLHTFFKPEATQKGITLLVKNLLSPNETIIKTDREKLYAVLTNLIKNALKFTNSGTIEFGCEKKGKNLEFFVKDTGLGISNSQKEIIFERFRQANDTTTQSTEGSGLGLAISKAYIETMGGKIWVESEEGKGSNFYFTLPHNPKSGQKENIVSKKIKSEEIIENKIKDLKILIVEDDAISKLLITIAVKPFSKEIIKVSTGFEAIDACRNNPDIDLVMMDINMPEMGGYEATKKIRTFNKNVVIIAQTANGMQSDHDKAIAAGCTDYISKPINITSLSKLIQQYFKK
jgi:PAS domain S-box-containing protein